MNYASYKKYDMVNGKGVRNSLFVSGCTHKCKGCFNEKAQDFKYGSVFDINTLSDIVTDLYDSKVQGLSVLGGEPMQNRGVLGLVKSVRAFHGDRKDIWLWSGYTFEELMAMGDWQMEVLTYIDVLVDGKFIEEQKDLSLQFRGSRNQRVIDVKKSLEIGEVVLWQDTIHV